MRRRELLKTAVSGWALSFAPAPLQSALAASGPVQRRWRPTDPQWPGAELWRQLERAVNGNLIQVQPLLASCTADASSKACADVIDHLRNPFYLGDQAGGTQVSGWYNAWTPAPSAYAIHAQSAADVAAGVNFAREHNLRLVVKGTGHSYQGTSNCADSLLIWTRAMNQVTLHDRFVPKGGEGRVDPVPAVTAEAGAVWIDLYHAVTEIGGRYVQGGGCTDVGVAGLVQSGGFGSFSKGFGLAAANLLEAEIVTADGQLRTVSAFSDPELFWALKGGGGGSWGVVTRVTLRTHELPAHFGGAYGKIKAKSEAGFRRLLDRFFEFYATALLNPHWGEQIHLEPDYSLRISMTCQGLKPEETRQVWAPFFDWVRHSSDELAIVREPGTYDAGNPRDYWKVEGNDSMTPDRRQGATAWHGWWQGDQAQVGAWLHGYDSLWLPKDLLDPKQRPQLVDALLAAVRSKALELHFNKGLAGALPEVLDQARQTATNPAVCEAFALVIIADGEAPTYPGLPHAAPDLDRARKDAAAIDAAAAALRKIAPEAGSYVSESNFFNNEWPREFWGNHYPRLQAAKQAYDPEGLFFVHHGVGSQEWSEDGFTRRAAT